MKKEINPGVAVGVIVAILVIVAGIYFWSQNQDAYHRPPGPVKLPSLSGGGGAPAGTQ